MTKPVATDETPKICPSCLAGPGQGHDPDCNADRRPRVNGVLVCKCEYSAMLQAELSALRADPMWQRINELGERLLAVSEEPLQASRAPEPGVVTREHREAVSKCFPTAQPGLLNTWVKSGSTAGIPSNFEALGQAIADAEARGAARVTPPGEEVAGLLAGVKLLRDACHWWYGNPDSNYGPEWRALDQIEAFIRGAR